MAVYDKMEHQVSGQNIDVDLQTSWILGEYKFKEITLYEITKRLERYYHLSFIFDNEELKQRKFTGTFYNNQSAEMILKVIQASTNMHYTVENNTIYIK